MIEKIFLSSISLFCFSFSFSKQHIVSQIYTVPDNNMSGGISFRKLFQKQIRKTISINDNNFRFMPSFSILAVIQDGPFDVKDKYIITYLNQEEEEQTKAIKQPWG